MRGVIVVDLRLAVQQHAARPVEVILVEVVRARLMLSRALVVLERIRLVLLPKDMDLKFGAAFQPTLKRLCEMTLGHVRSEEHTSELQSRLHLVCRLLLEKKKNNYPGPHRYFRNA